MSIAQMRRALAEASTAFANHPDVTLVGIGEKHTGGVNTKDYAIVIYVEKKGQVRGGEIPESLRTKHGTYPTDVLELPYQAITQTNTQLDGADLLIDAASGRSGTLGFVAEEDGGLGRFFGITNAHVVSNTGQDARGANVKANVNGVRKVIGKVSHHTVLHDDGRINKPDVALIELNAVGTDHAAKYQIEAWKTQPIDGVASLSAAPQAGSRLPHEYASKARGVVDVVTGASPFEVTNLPMIARDTGRPILFSRAYHARVIQPVQGGHSGSALTRLRVSGNSRALTGLVFGGRGGDLFAFAWRDVAETIKNDFRIDI